MTHKDPDRIDQLASLTVGTFPWVDDLANDLAPFKPGGSLWALFSPHHIRKLCE